MGACASSSATKDLVEEKIFGCDAGHACQCGDVQVPNTTFFEDRDTHEVLGSVPFFAAFPWKLSLILAPLCSIS